MYYLGTDYNREKIIKIGFIILIYHKFLIYELVIWNEIKITIEIIGKISFSDLSFRFNKNIEKIRMLKILFLILVPLL